MHCGWGVLVAVNENVEILDRRRIIVANQAGPRGNQPYHYAQQLGLGDAEQFLVGYGAEACRLAEAELAKSVCDLNLRGYKPVGAAILLASARKLPALVNILAAHPLIHTAEGELFREAMRHACESLSIPATGMPEREIESRAKDVFGSSTPKLMAQLKRAGKSIGPPWNADHKCAALAACIALHLKGRKAVSGRA
jgi:hypothetical protein